MMQNSDLMGDGVNVAARLQGAAEPGGICVSGSVYDQTRNKLSLSFESRGERRFKNIPQPVRTFIIAGTEDHGALPVSKKRVDRPGVAVISAVVAASLFVFAGGYWAYTTLQRSQADHDNVGAKTLPALHAAPVAGAKPANMLAPVKAIAKPVTSSPEIQSSTLLPNAAPVHRPQRQRALTDADTEAGSEADADNNIPSAIFDQITEAKAADAACLDATKVDPSAAASSEICSRRDKLVAELRTKGWCGSAPGDVGVRKIWNECR